MQKTRGPWLWILMLSLSLAGCATTSRHDGDYSSLPAAPQHPPHAAPQPSGQTAGHPPSVRAMPQLPPEEYEDLLDRIRSGFALPDVDHYEIDRQVEQYRSRPDFLDRTFRRGGRYLHFIVEEIEKRGLPGELALLPIVESAFNPVAYSRSRASGLWQFIPSTGKHYGLEQSWWLDERRDVIESTQAALTYLNYLSQYFQGDWLLAIAAYNGGEGTVSRARDRNAQSGRGTDFFSLNLVTETREYVPKLLALRRLVGNPEAYGLQFSAIPNRPYFTVIDPGRQMHLGDAADLAGITRDEMFALNPSFNRMTTPPKGPHRLLLPVQSADTFTAALAAGPAAAPAPVVEPPRPVRHTVRRGDTLTSIARNYGVSTDALREANGLRGSTIQKGQQLLIPGATTPGRTMVAAAEPRPDLVAQLPERQAAEPRPKAKTRHHTVKAGENLWGIARKYGVSVPSLAAANGLSSKSQVRTGQRLEIPGSSAGGKSAAGSGGDSVRMTYKVRRGDTLSEIADKFNVSIRQLMSWNNLRGAKSLRTGQRLVLYVDPDRTRGG